MISAVDYTSERIDSELSCPQGGPVKRLITWIGLTGARNQAFLWLHDMDLLSYGLTHIPIMIKFAQSMDAGSWVYFIGRRCWGEMPVPELCLCLVTYWDLEELGISR